MLNYSFGLDVFNKPSICELGKTEYWMLGELSFITASYAAEVVHNLEKVLSGEIEEYEYGYDATIIDFYPKKAVINYNYFKDIKDIDSLSIYELMRDWRDYLGTFK